MRLCKDASAAFPFDDEWDSGWEDDDMPAPTPAQALAEERAYLAARPHSAPIPMASSARPAPAPRPAAVELLHGLDRHAWATEPRMLARWTAGGAPTSPAPGSPPGWRNF